MNYRSLSAASLAGSLAVWGCQAKQEPPKPATDIVADTRMMEQAQQAANTVVRAAGDCDAVRAALPEALRALEEAQASLKTAAGAATLTAIRTRVDQVASMCPQEAPASVK